MLNPFPELLDFGLIAVFVLRATLGLFFVRFGYLKLTRDRGAKERFFSQAGLHPAKVFLYGIAILELAGGAALLVGLFTQVAAAALSLIMLGAAVIKIRGKNALSNDIEFYILLFVATLSLLFLGAGIFAFDLPL